MPEAKNCGATLMIYGLLYGTYVYRPGVPPADLGVCPTINLPPYARNFAVMTLPLRMR